MVQGQAIGIPFRRRKGGQAPPPPTEVAWNPTIESNMPYKDVTYFKFVEGGGWQALNVGEILPVGSRIMIRITTTEIYYEVSEAASSQLGNIQIGKNGDSEYDIAGTLTVHSPQIISVTIGVDKNYVQWNPTYNSNVGYQDVVCLNYSDSLKTVNVGDYVKVGDTLAVRVILANTLDEVANANVNGQKCEIVVVSPRVFDCKFVITSNSPQTVDITIDEYIRYEDITQAFPLFFEFTDENGNLFSWGDKAKVGSTITRTKGVAYANLLEDFYTITNPRLNGVPLSSASHIVEKQMIFTCTATWIGTGNEPKTILFPERLSIPNSSLKILGYIPDLSGHGNHGVINGSDFAGMSGANGYLQNFSDWTKATGVTSTDSTIVSGSNLDATKGWVAYVRSGTVIPTFKVQISGIPTNGNLRFEGSDQSLANGVNTIQGLTAPRVTGFYISSGYDNDWSNLKIEQIGEYEGAFCFDGVKDYATFADMLGGKQVLMKCNWQKANGLLYDQRISNSSFAILPTAEDDNVNNRLAYEARNLTGTTYLDGIKNEHVLTYTLKDITHNITATNSSTNVGKPVIGASNRSTTDFFEKFAMFCCMVFDEIDTPEDILTLNKNVGIAGSYVEKPDLYWDVYGKKNTDADRATIQNRGTLEGDYDLEVVGVDYDDNSGYGGASNKLTFGSGTERWDIPSGSSMVYTTFDDGYGVTITKTNSGNNTALFYSSTTVRRAKAWYRVTGLQPGKGLVFGSLPSQPLGIRINVDEDGVYEVDWTKNVTSGGSGLPCSIYPNNWSGDCNIKIEQLSEYENGLLSDGVKSYCVCSTTPILTDYTWIMKRKWVDKKNLSCLASKCEPELGAFTFEWIEDQDAATRSFGGSPTQVDFPELISWQTKDNYNGTTITVGNNPDYSTLYIFRNRDAYPYYCKAVLYKAMLCSKTIDMLSIGMLCNMLEKDELIDLSNPVFKQ